MTAMVRLHVQPSNEHSEIAELAIDGEADGRADPDPGSAAGERAGQPGTCRGRPRGVARRSGRARP